MIYGYIRVSTDKQTAENQRLVINDWAKKNNVVIDEFISETKSGAVKPNERKLGTLLNRLKAGDTLIVTELSRLGRSLIMIFDLMQLFLDRKIKVEAIKENFTLADDIQSKVLAFAFGLSAEIERQLIIERTNAGIARAKAKGIHCGRFTGRKNDHVKLDKYRKKIIQMYKAGVSIRSLSLLYNVRWQTMQSYLIRTGMYIKRRDPTHTINIFTREINILN